MSETTAFNLPQGLQGKVSVKIAPIINKSVFRCINANNAGVVYVVSGDSIDRKTVDLVVYDPTIDVDKKSTLETYERRRLASVEMDVNKLTDLRHPNNPDALDVKSAIRRLNIELNKSSYVETSGGVVLDENSARVSLSSVLPNISTNYWLNSGARFFEVDYSGINFGRHKKAISSPLSVSISAPFYNALREEHTVNVTIGYHDPKVPITVQRKLGKLSFPSVSFVSGKTVVKGAWNDKDDQDIMKFVQRVVKDIAEFKHFEGWFPRKKLSRSIAYHSGRKINAEFVYPEGNSRMTIPTAFIIETLNDQECLKVTERPNSGYGKSMTHRVESMDGSETVKLTFIPMEDVMNSDLSFDGYVDDYKSWNRNSEFKRGSVSTRLETLVSQLYQAGIMTFNSDIKSVADAIAFIQHEAEAKGLDKIKYKNSGSLKAIARNAPPAYGDETSLSLEQLFEKRGLSKESLSYCINNGLVQMGRHPDEFRGGSENLAIGNNTDLVNPRKIIAQQFFSEQSNGKIFKAWASNANSSKASFNVGDPLDAEDLIMTEATFDAIALRDLFIRCGIPVEDKLISSVNSTAYLSGFFEQNFGILLPQEKDVEKGVVGYVLEQAPVEFLREESEVAEKRTSIVKGLASYESVVFVHSGTEESRAKYECLTNVLKGDLQVTLDKNKGRYLTGNYDYMRKNIKHIIIDETNFDEIMADAGVKFTSKNEPMYFSTKKQERKPIYNSEAIESMNFGKQEALSTIEVAKSRIKAVMPNLERAYYGFDNDGPGLSSAKTFCNLTRELGFGGHLMAPPLMSKKSLDVNLSQLQDVYDDLDLDNKALVKKLCNDSKVSPFDIVNDWNDLTRLDDSYTRKIEGYFSAALSGMLDDDTMFESFVKTAKAVDSTRKVAEDILEEEALKAANKNQRNNKRSFR
ncbi:hypothetical protein [Vibrio sp. D431a]|uniref:hypothetical protein n=1 Tax=Vibrio sp. D431a TaxID=2837388 RepID=UPI002557AB26|nr:hypothetical protein [Vibrio sp. D431a]MDK9790615.1 hypothetical protein [Vibrio sp. D431a]